MTVEEGRMAAPEATSQARRIWLPRPITRPTLTPLVLRRPVIAVAAIWLFVIAIRTLSIGGAGIEPVLDALSVSNPIDALGFAWLGAYGVLSGSPIAAITMTLFDGDLISRTEAFAMLNGSRFGASFIVLFVGFAAYVLRKREPDGIYIGVIALLTAFSLNLPVLILGLGLLESGLLDGVQFDLPALVSIVETVADPAAHRIDDALPVGLVFVVGVGMLLTSFQMFDRALPQLEAADERFERLVVFLHRRWAMFAVGFLMTAMTLSVSVSLTVLIPLSLKGYVRRDGVVPYVMGANISTWIDTLVASLLLGNPDAFTIVLAQMIVGLAVSLLILGLLYRPYESALLGLSRRIVASRRSLATFLAIILIVPTILLVAS
ncbi:MAG TPA: hypothetical protein VNL92_04550 [Dehalococcoidia bacterium]|nr:hypothetical protein [Dehalococcoidia bacterium]